MRNLCGVLVAVAVLVAGASAAGADGERVAWFAEVEMPDTVPAWPVTMPDGTDWFCAPAGQVEAAGGFAVDAVYGCEPVVLFCELAELVCVEGPLSE